MVLIIDNDEKVASSKKNLHDSRRVRNQYDYDIYDQNG